MSKNSLNRGLWARIRPFIKAHKKLIIISLMIVPVLSLLNLSQPFMVKVAIDDYILKKNLSGLRMIALVYLIVFVFEYILNFTQVYLMQLTGQKIVHDLRRALFRKVQSLDASYFDKTPVGVTLTRLTGDCEVINDLFSSGIVSLVWDVFRLVLTVVAMALLDWRLTLIAFSVVPVLFLVVIFFRKLLREGYGKVRQKLAALNVFIQEHVNGIRIIQSFGQEKVCSLKFRHINENYKDANLSTIKYDAVLYAFVEAVSSIAVGLIIWYGGGSMVQGLVTFGVLVAFIEYIQRFFIPIRDLSSKFAIIQSAAVSFERIFNLLEYTEKITPPQNPLHMPSAPATIEVKGLNFSYEKDIPILKDISFQVGAGEKVAIVGSTGSGKSTLFKLLSRYYDLQSGEILIEGQNIEKYALEELRRYFAVVPQDVFLFSGTVADNIRLFRPEISSQRVMEAAQQVGAHSFIQKFPGAYEQQVSPRGGNLSMGERQLIAMARGLVFESPVLLLDEATAHIDPHTTRVLQNAMDQMARKHTVFVAAHRLSTIQKMDRIFVFHKGEIKESGTHEELMQQKGLYSKLCQLDFVAE